MVTSPVGARCPDCSRIGRPAILDTSSSEMGRAILFALGSAVLSALLFSVIIRLLVEIAILGSIGFILVAGGLAGIGYVVGEAVRFGSGKKIDRRLRYVAAGGVFVAWVAVAAWLPILSVSSNLLISNFGGIIGLIIAFYVATSRIRV